jgi:hypothetical protein
MVAMSLEVLEVKRRYFLVVIRTCIIDEYSAVQRSTALNFVAPALLIEGMSVSNMTHLITLS